MINSPDFEFLEPSLSQLPRPRTLFFGDVENFKHKRSPEEELKTATKISMDEGRGDLLFAWLSPIEANVDKKLHTHPVRAKSPSPNSPLLRAKSAIRKTFSAGHRSQDYREKVREAQEASFWLRAAGFPQYVQMYRDGQFPISLSKFQVERDHSFLDQAAIDALIRRLNTLNRCADIVDEIRTKNDDSDDDMRALSEHWHFKRKARRWSRKRRAADDRESSITPPAGTPTSPAPPMLVSELRNSLSDLDRRIKTYSFLPGEDFCLLLDFGDSPPGSASDSGLSKTTDLSDTASFSPSTSWGGLSDSTVLDGSMENFATGILDTFDVSLNKLREAKSQSLPDVFKACELDTGASTTDDSYVSTTSVSTPSAMDSKEVMDDAYSASTPTVHVNGHTEPGVMLLHTPPSSRGVRRADSVKSEESVSLEQPAKGSEEVLPQQAVTRTDSAGELSTYPEVLSRNSTLARSNDGSLKKYRSAKWHSFQKLYSFQRGFKPVRSLIPIEELSSGQIGVLKKLCLVKLTALLELHKAKTNVAQLFRGKKPKQPDSKNKSVFGVALCVNVQRNGQALPQSILGAMERLRELGLETKGVFRRPGSKAKVDTLRELNEANPDNTCYEGYSSYDIADLIKLYFRQLPEPLLTSKLSEILITIYENIPGEVRLQALQAVVLLMPDENREALQTLLYFLSEVAAYSEANQMDAQNLAVCLAPTLFSLPSSLAISKPSTLPLMRRGSFRRNTTNHSPSLTSTKEVTDSVSSSQCLAEMIRCADQLFMVAADMLQVCKFSHLEFMDPVPCHELGRDQYGFGNLRNFVDTCVTAVLKEARHSFKGWVYHESVRGADVSSLKISDSIPLRLWRGVVKVPATPLMILRKLWTHRHVWNGEVQKARQVASIDYQTEVYQYVTPSMPPLTDRDHCVLRSWRFDPALGCYVLVATSVSHPSADLLAGIRATELASRYLIEPLDGGTSKLTYICRVDMRGCSADYYNSFGPYLASTVVNIRDSIKPLDYLETPI